MGKKLRAAASLNLSLTHHTQSSPLLFLFFLLFFFTPNPHSPPTHPIPDECALPEPTKLAKASLCSVQSFFGRARPRQVSPSTTPQPCPPAPGPPSPAVVVRVAWCLRRKDYTFSLSLSLAHLCNLSSSAPSFVSSFSTPPAARVVVLPSPSLPRASPSVSPDPDSPSEVSCASALASPPNYPLLHFPRDVNLRAPTAAALARRKNWCLDSCSKFSARPSAIHMLVSLPTRPL